LQAKARRAVKLLVSIAAHWVNAVVADEFRPPSTNPLTLEIRLANITAEPWTLGSDLNQMEAN
jgi:hypothetical protein